MVREMDFVDECYADKDLSLLKKLTLVIPTYNRNYYLSRCLWYHAHFPFGQIIVADSSPEEKKVVNRETVSKIRELFVVDILYLEYEPETEKYGGDIYQKWGDAVMHVETEYSQICTDKEFLVPSSMLQSIELLDSNQEYSVSDGDHIHIEALSDTEYTYSIIPSFSSNSNSSVERLREISKNPGCTLLALHRTKTLKKIYQSLFDNNISDIRFGEIYLELLDVIHGKTYKINNVHTYRDTLKFSESDVIKMKQESSAFRYPQLWEYPEPIYQEKYQRFLQGIISQLSQTNRTDLHDKNLETILEEYIQKRMGKSHPLRNISMIKSLFYKLPRNIQKTVLRMFLNDSCGISDFSERKKTIELNSEMTITKLMKFNEIPW